MTIIQVLSMSFFKEINKNYTVMVGRAMLSDDLRIIISYIFYAFLLKIFNKFLLVFFFKDEQKSNVLVIECVF